MSKSKAISLKDLALQICGDTSRTNYRVASVEYRLIDYIRAGRLVFWLDGNPYPAISIIDETYNRDLYDGIPINKRDWYEHAKTNAPLLEIELEDLDRFLSDAILKNGVLKAECKTAVAQENRNLKKVLKPSINQRLPLSFAERHLANAIAEGDFLTQLKTWRHMAANAGRGRISSKPTSYQAKVDHFHKVGIKLFDEIRKDNPSANTGDLMKNNKFIQARKNSELFEKEWPSQETWRRWISQHKKSLLPTPKKA